MDLGIAGKVAAVAAASRGLGFATAAALLAEGASVAICGRDPERLETAASHLRAHGGDVHVAVCDLVAPGACEAFIDGAVGVFGRLDIVVANAGGPRAAAVLDLTDDDFRAAFELNALTSIRVARAAVPHLRAHGDGGRILFITSSAVKQPIDALGLSNAARAAATGYARTLANALARERITVNTIAPGYHDTDRLRQLAGDLSGLSGTLPAGRLGSAEDFGAIACFLASQQANYLTGQTIVVDGGLVRSLL